MAEAFQTLVIIGNGFDMAHGYHTDYKSFVDQYADSNSDLKWFETYCKDNEVGATWYFFEENIKTLTTKLFEKRITEDFDGHASLDEGVWLERVYGEIQRLLMQYLRRELRRRPMSKLPSVEKYLNENGKAINFNYTKTAENYTDNIFYVHGSLDEDDIVLGYDDPSQPCLMPPEYMRFSKNLRREALAFRRFLRQECGLNSESERYKALLEDLGSYQYWGSSNRGIDDEIKQTIPHFEFIEQFMQSYVEHHEIPNMDYEGISRLVVMGHGIEADQVFLKEIVSKCVNLQEVVIFLYDEESENSAKKKKQFFVRHCSRVGDHIRFEYY